MVVGAVGTIGTGDLWIALLFVAGFIVAVSATARERRPRKHRRAEA